MITPILAQSEMQSILAAMTANIEAVQRAFQVAVAEAEAEARAEQEAQQTETEPMEDES